MSVVCAWSEHGCRDLHVNRGIIEMHRICQRYNIHLDIKWISTTKQLADEPSRIFTHNESELRQYLRKSIIRYLSPNLDLFAGRWNNLTERYYSLDWHPSSFGTNGISYEYLSGDVIYLYPPRSLVGLSLKTIEAAPQVTMVMHIYGHHDSAFALAQNIFEYSVVIGHSQQPACATPGRKRVGYEGRQYFRPYYEVPQTVLLLKGFPLATIKQLRLSIQCRSLEHDPVRRCATKWMNLLNRRLNRTNRSVGFIQPLPGIINKF